MIILFLKVIIQIQKNTNLIKRREKNDRKKIIDLKGCFEPQGHHIQFHAI